MLEDQHLKKSHSFEGLYLCTETGVLREGQASAQVCLNLGKRMKALDLRRANASHDSDKRFINRLVYTEKGSFDVFNDYICNYIKSAIKKAQNKANTDLEKIFVEVEDSDAEARSSDEEIPVEVIQKVDQKVRCSDFTPKGKKVNVPMFS